MPGRLAVIGALLDALVLANMVDTVPRAPVSKARVSFGVDEWSDAGRIERMGVGTCPSIVAARIAELRKAGERATWSFGFEGRLQVVRASGAREDPCAGSLPVMQSVLTSRALWTPTVQLVSFETTPPDLKMKVLCRLLDVLHTANDQWLAAGNTAPSLYDGSFRYVEEQIGHDEWQDMPETILRRTGDCEDFASYRVSELRAQGERANHVVEHRFSQSDDLVLYHILVRRGDGAIEDPSCKLGMGGDCRVFLTSAQVQSKVTNSKAAGRETTAGVAPVQMTAEDAAAAAMGWQLRVEG